MLFLESDINSSRRFGNFVSINLLLLDKNILFRLFMPSHLPSPGLHIPAAENNADEARSAVDRLEKQKALSGLV